MPAADAALHGFGAFADSTTAEREERTNTMRNELPVDEAFFQRSLRVTEPDVRYTDIREEPFAIHGLYAPQTEPNLKRLSDSVGRAINETAARLYTNPSGGRVRFATDSRYIAVRVRVPYVARRTIMPLLTTAGIDVYAREDGRDVYQTSIRPPRDMTDGYESIAYLPDRRMREVTLYLPLYNDVTSVEIGLQADARLTPAQERARALPVVFYGSSITQGASASRPGMSYPAIAARLLDCDFVNLGFASAARGEQSVAAYIASLPCSAFVLDYDYNAPTPEHLRATHRAFCETVRSGHPDIPILMLSRPVIRQTEETRLRREIILETWRAARERGDARVRFLDGYAILGEQGREDCLADGIHPNDLGAYRMAAAVARALAEEC